MMLLIEAALRSCALTAAVWLVLKALRIRNPHVTMTAWIGVLLASLAMPVLMRWVPAQALPVPSEFYHAWTLTRVAPVGAATAAPPESAKVADSLSWTVFLLPAYLLIAAILVARLAVGLMQSLRLVRRAERVDAPWACGHDMRLSPDLSVPVTIGGIILLPDDFLDWNTAKRSAVVAHEASHVGRYDFYVLLLAALHQSLFWISPAAWWLNSRLADLAEANSDAAALASLEDRASYVEILIDLASKARPLPAGVAMARQTTVRRRIERILAERTIPARLTAKTRVLVLAGVIPAALAVAGATTVPGLSEADHARNLADQARPRIAIAMSLAVLDKFAGYYALGSAPNLPFKVWREADGLLAATLGQPPMELLPESEHGFFMKNAPSQEEFQLDEAGRVVSVVLHQNGDEEPAYRLDDAAGRALEKKLSDRIAANIPQPGSEAALRSHITQLQRGEIDDDTLITGMAYAVHALLPKIRPAMVALGPITATRFDGVGSDGMDLYTVTHEKGVRTWRIRLAPDGRIESMWFTPAA